MPVLRDRGAPNLLLGCILPIKQRSQPKIPGVKLIASLQPLCCRLQPRVRFYRPFSPTPRVYGGNPDKAALIRLQRARETRKPSYFPESNPASLRGPLTSQNSEASAKRTLAETCWFPLQCSREIRYNTFLKFLMASFSFSIT